MAEKKASLALGSEGRNVLLTLSVLDPIALSVVSLGPETRGSSPRRGDVGVAVGVAVTRWDPVEAVTHVTQSRLRPNLVSCPPKDRHLSALMPFFHQGDTWGA